MAAIRASGRLLVSRCCFNSEFRMSVPEEEVIKLGFVSFGGSNAVGLAWTSRRIGLLRPIKYMSTIGESTNIVWHESSVEKPQRQELLQQKGSVIWITGLSGSGKSTLACALSRDLHLRGKLTYILDGDNVRHGLNSDLSFKAEDRTENVRRIGEVAKLFADAGVICIASLISPFRWDRDACRGILPEGSFIEVFLDVPLNICEARDPKGLYRLARSGKIKGFTGIDGPYEPPVNCEMAGKHRSPTELAETVISYLDEKGYLQAL